MKQVRVVSPPVVVRFLLILLVSLGGCSGKKQDDTLIRPKQKVSEGYRVELNDISYPGTTLVSKDSPDAPTITEDPYVTVNVPIDVYEDDKIVVLHKVEQAIRSDVKNQCTYWGSRQKVDRVVLKTSCCLVDKDMRSLGSVTLLYKVYLTPR